MTADNIDFSFLSQDSNESLQTDLSGNHFLESNVSIVSSFCDDKKLGLAFLALPILLISLALGIFIKSYHGPLDESEKNIVVFFDIAITNYLQESKIFVFDLLYKSDFNNL